MIPDKAPVAELGQYNMAEEAESLYTSAEFNRVIPGVMAVEVGKRFAIKVYAIVLDEDIAKTAGLSERLLLIEDLQHHGATCSHDRASNSVGYLLNELGPDTYFEAPRHEVSIDRHSLGMSSSETLSSLYLEYITGEKRIPRFFETDFAEYLARELARLKAINANRIKNLAEATEGNMASDLIWLKIINRDREIATSS